MVDSDLNPSSNKSMIIESPEELQKIFNQFDANSDGLILIEEPGGVMKALRSSYTEEELRRVMDDVDTNKDSYINLSEFATLCQSASIVDELWDAFDLYNHHRNGLISATELKLVLNHLKMSCSKDNCINMINSVNFDSDGHVNFKEFQKMM